MFREVKPLGGARVVGVFCEAVEIRFLFVTAAGCGDPRSVEVRGETVVVVHLQDERLGAEWLVQVNVCRARTTVVPSGTVVASSSSPYPMPAGPTANALSSKSTAVQPLTDLFVKDFCPAPPRAYFQLAPGLTRVVSNGVGVFDGLRASGGRPPWWV
ncbi:MAG: hypothetical protein CM1200mP2_53280 [Planctomycetaceae bacterium]|nr:MAG: hypothetical protein CM1200mP2_53280 [Planctomycetaceae bacterium]